MTREMKVGLAVAVLLVGVFSFLAYKRFMRPQGTAAQAEQTSDNEGEPSGEGDVTAAENPFLEPDVPSQPKPKTLPVANVAREIPEEDVDDPFGGPARSAPSNTAAASRPKLPTLVSDDDSFLEQPQPEDSDDLQVTVATTEPEMDGDDPFSDGPAVVPVPAKSAPVVRHADVAAEQTKPVEDDPFVVESASPAPLPKPSKQSPPIALRTSPDEPETVSLQARTKLPEPTFEDDEEESSDEAGPAMSRSLPLKAKVPSLRTTLEDSDEDRYGDYEPIELVAGVDGDAPLEGNAQSSRDEIDFFDPSDERRVPITIAGDSHVVQPGDNFWSISQRKYGTGRYFQALAAHNQHRIPDPVKMKPGTTISLPPEEELIRRYPHLIPKPGPSEPGAADPRAVQRGEFLVGQDGQLLYRIGAGDTLSGIAQKYLGRSSRWMQILEMNRDVLKDGNSLKVGGVLRLPADASDERLSAPARLVR
jgi:nucleoid-associated protein YgaU